MKINAIITGSTGMVGQGVLLECLEHPEVEKVLVINRQTLGLQHEKLREIIHQDFSDLSAIRSELIGYNTCFFCLGVSSAGLPETQYEQTTYHLTLNFAKAMLELNPDMAFSYVSGAGTDSSEKGRMMWARVKGKTENGLLKLGFKNAYMFRPGFIQPQKGIRSRTSLYNIFYTLAKPFYPLLQKIPKYVTSTEKLGKAMIYVASKGYNKQILESVDINCLD